VPANGALPVTTKNARFALFSEPESPTPVSAFCLPVTA
jgi:hypothetical protein